MKYNVGENLQSSSAPCVLTARPTATGEKRCTSFYHRPRPRVGANVRSLVIVNRSMFCEIILRWTNRFSIGLSGTRLRLVKTQETIGLPLNVQQRSFLIQLPFRYLTGAW